MFKKRVQFPYLVLMMVVCFFGEVCGQTLINSSHSEASGKSLLSIQEISSDLNRIDANYDARKWSFKTEGFKPEQEEEGSDESTSSWTVGYIGNEYNVRTDSGSYKYRYNGTLSSLMISSNSSSFTLSYGVAEAEEYNGDIRSIAADLHVGGNISIFDDFLGLPLRSYIPVRVDLGYRNLALIDKSEKDRINMGNGGLGAGIGAQLRIPTGLPWLEDNLTVFASLVRSVGALGDLSGSEERRDFNSQPQEASISGVRLTRGTDFNIEGKFERILGGSVGITVGMTLRWLSWMDEPADSFGQIFDVASGQQKNIELLSTRSLLRIGLNW